MRYIICIILHLILGVSIFSSVRYFLELVGANEDVLRILVSFPLIFVGCHIINNMTIFKD